MAAIGLNAAEDLAGTTLPSGWNVIEKMQADPLSTGGNFSISYNVVHRDGRTGFCKVLNYHWLLQAQTHGLDPLDAMDHATSVYKFERDLARECVGLSKVVTALDDGSFTVPGYQQGLVSYIVFEMAERDIRGFLNRQNEIDLVGRLRALHHLATGIRQLHFRGVAHQDVKPSNTLTFPQNIAGERLTKIGDLGRATVQGRPMDHDTFPIAGDPTYAPPEALYGAVPLDFAPRRLGCDLYQLGSMITFVMAGVTVNSMLHRELHPSLAPSAWTGTYEQVLPYVRDAFGRALDRIADAISSEIRDDVVSLIRQLCDPDPAHRGHRRDVSGTGNQYALDRIVTELDRLSRQASLRARGVA